MAGLFVVGALVGMAVPSPARAATGINQTLNFQGRLLTASGAVVPDGTYNIEFKIYQDGDGVLGGGDETLKWTEGWVYGSGSPDRRVVVRNGYFSVRLGSITTFGSSVDWNQDTLWLSMNVGNTSTAASFAAASGDGEMSPFRRLGSSVYALNAGQLGGLTSGQFVQFATGTVQTDSSTNASVFLNKTAATGDLITLQKNAALAFSVDNDGDILFGSNGDHTIKINSSASGLVGRSLTLQAGTGGPGTGSAGGDTTIQGGNAGGTNGDAGNLYLMPGTKTGTGTAGSVIVKAQNNSSNSFQVQNSSGVALMVADTANSRVGINTSAALSATLEVLGSVKFGGTSTSLFTTPTGGTPANLNAKISITSLDPGANGHVVALGVTRTAQGTARGLTVYDARDTAHEGISLGVMNPTAEDSIIGFTWNGGNSVGLVQTQDRSAATKEIVLQSGNVSGLAGNSGKAYIQSGTITGGNGTTSGDVIVQSGNALGTNVSSGNVLIDSGSRQAGTGTNGYINIGATNASAINIGQASANILTTVRGTALFKPTTGNDSATAFQIQNAGGTQLFNVSSSANSANLISNGSIEQNTTGWVGKLGTETLTSITSQNLYGNGSLQIDTPTTTSAGVKQNITLTAGTQYTLSFYAKSTASYNSFYFGYACNGSDETGAVCSGTASGNSSIVTGGWTRYSVTFTPTAISSTPYIYIKQNSSGTARTFYIDGVELEANTSSGRIGPYREGTFQLNGAITSPLQVMSTSDSSSAFAVASSTGASVLNVDTLNANVAIGSISAPTKLYVTASGTASARFNQTGSNNILELQDAGVNVLSVNGEGTVNFGTTLAHGGAGTVGNSASSPTVTGTGTAFSSSLKAGDTLTFTSGVGESCTVLSVASDTSLTCTANVVNVHTNATYNITGAGVSDRMVIQGNGRVGIGTAAASALGLLTLGNVTSTAGQGVAGSIVFADGTNNNLSLLLNMATLSGGSKTITLPNASGTICLDTGNCGALILQTAYTNSTGGTTPEILVDNIRKGVDIQNDGTLSGIEPLLAVRNTATSSTLGSAYFQVVADGRVGIGALASNTALNVTAATGMDGFRVTGGAGTSSGSSSGGFGGALQMTSGVGGSGGGASNNGGGGGDIGITGGVGGGSALSIAGNGGSINLTAGNGGDSVSGVANTGGFGGNVMIKAGNGGGTGAFNTGGEAGDITLQAGQGGINLPGGDVFIKGGASVLNGSGGNLVLAPGANNGGTSNGIVQIGAVTADTSQYNLVLDTSTTFTDSGTCGSTVATGALYFSNVSGSSTASGTSAIRACMTSTSAGSGWQDVVTTDALGTLLFGVVPDSGANKGDIASLNSPGISGPCKVSAASATTVRIESCVAYTQYRRVLVSQNTSFSIPVTNGWTRICLTGSDFSIQAVGGGTDTSMPSFMAPGPQLCLAHIVAGGSGITQVYDTRTFTTTQKEFYTVASGVSIGNIVTFDSTTKSAITRMPVGVGGGNVVGVVVATDGGTSTTSPKALVATSGPVWAKANGGTVGEYVQASGSLGNVTTLAAAPTNPYSLLGISRTTATNGVTCSGAPAAANCNGSIFFVLNIK